MPGLEGVVAASVENVSGTTNDSSSSATPTTNNETNSDQSEANQTPPSHSTDTPAVSADQGADGEVSSTPAPAATPVSQDPRYAPYFRMLRMGVPEPAVRMKMSTSGIDPAILE